MSNADAADQTHAHSQAMLKFHRMVDEIKAFRPDADYRFSLANSAGLLSVKDSFVHRRSPWYHSIRYYAVFRCAKSLRA